jgi:hypothetical protein
VQQRRLRPRRLQRRQRSKKGRETSGKLRVFVRIRNSSLSGSTGTEAK